MAYKLEQRVDEDALQVMAEVKRALLLHRRRVPLHKVVKERPVRSVVLLEPDKLCDFVVQSGGQGRRGVGQKNQGWVGRGRVMLCKDSREVEKGPSTHAPIQGSPSPRTGTGWD